MNNLESEKNKFLLKIEDVLVLTNLVQFLAIFLIVPLHNHETIDFAYSVLMGISLIVFLVTVFYALKIETEAGYYECGKCKHRYVPTYKKVFLAAHVGKTRYMECPECHAKSWQHKVLTKN